MNDSTTEQTAKQRVEIRDWSIIDNRLHGYVDNHPVLGNAGFIRTSQIVKANVTTGIVQTRNTLYVLIGESRKPPPKYDPATQPGSPEFDGAEAYEAHLAATVGESMADHLKGHKSIAEMVSTHISVWREALAHMLTNKAYDSAYVEHEMKALNDIEAACKAEVGREPR